MTFGQLVAFALLGTAAVAQSTPDVSARIRTHLATAQSAERTGNLAAAGSEYQAILEMQPELALIRQSLAITHHLQNRFLDAIREFRRAIATDPTLWGSYLFLGMDLYKTNQFAEALAPLHKSIELNAAMAESDARFWLGVTHLALGTPREAVEELRRAANLRARDLDTLYQLTRAYEMAAGELFEKIGAIEPAGAIVSLLQGERFLAEGRQELAALELGRAVGLRPDLAEWVAGIEFVRQQRGSGAVSGFDRRALEELSSLYRQHESSAKATALRNAVAAVRAATAEAGKSIPLLNEASQKTTNPWFRRYLLRAYSLNGQLAEAEALGRDLLAERPDDLDVLHLLGRHYKRLAALNLEKMIEVDPDAAVVHQLRAEMHEDRTQFDQALREYEAALKKNPAATGLRYAIGHVYAKSGKYEQAERWLKQELESNPHHTLAHARLGSLYVETGKSPDGILHLEQALQANPNLHTTRFDLARAYIAQNRLDDGIAALHAVIAAEPENDRVHYLLATAYTRQGRRLEAKSEMTKYQELTRKRLKRAQAEVQDAANSLK